MKILAVEDDPVAQLFLESALRSLGYEVVLADDGDTAWRALYDRTLRLVVCDWEMPRVSGLELCRHLRSRGGDYLYFILLTNRSPSDANQQAALEAGADDFLTKPVDVRELKMRLHVATRILNFTSQVKQLESFLPICGYCKKVRDDKNYWRQIEAYINERTGAQFSHGVCPDCYERVMLPQLKEIEREAKPKPRAEGL